MTDRFIGSTVYIDGRRFDEGTPESEIPKDFVSKVGSHIWVDEDPNVTPPTEEETPGVVYQLRQDLSTRDAENSALRSENSELKAEVERLSKVSSTQTDAPPVSDSATETDLSNLSQEELIALAGEHGIQVDPAASKEQLLAALQA